MRKPNATVAEAQLNGERSPTQPRARSRAALTWRVVQGKAGRSMSDCEISSSSSVQPTSTPWAPASHRLVDDLDHPAAGLVDDLAVHELLVDRGVEELVVLDGGHDHLHPVGRHPVGEEAVLHRHGRPDEPDRGHPRRLHGLGDDVGEVEQRDVDGGLDLVGDLVERRRAEHQEVGTGLLHAAGGVGEQLTDPVPALGVLQCRQLREVDRGEDQLGRREAAEPFLHAEVEVAVVDEAGFPGHAADESDGLHGESLSVQPVRPDAPCAGPLAPADGSRARRC